MNKQPRIGIAVAANNIEQPTIDRFLHNAHSAMATSDELEMSTEKTYGPFNKSRSLNDAIRKLIQKECDVIVQTDIDAEWSRELMDATRQNTTEGVHYWSPFLRNGIPCYYNTGAWNALALADWLKIGGFDERCFGWGGEDDLLHLRCRNAGFRRVCDPRHPFHHDHPDRTDWSLHQDKKQSGVRNLEAGLEENFVNYLKDSLPPYKGVTLHVTSRCLRRCPQCCLQDFLKQDRDYEISEEELDHFLQAVELSPYDIDRVIVCGGEPLLCKLLPLVIKRLDACPRIRQVSLFTSLVEGFDWDSIPRFNGVIRVSKYSFNEHLIEAAIKSGVNFQVADRSEHIILPERQYPESIPGYCMNPEVFIYQGRAYTCPMITQNLMRYQMGSLDSPLYSEPLTHRFLDRLRGWKTGAMPSCTGCVGNRNFEKITGWESH